MHLFLSVHVTYYFYKKSLVELSIARLQVYGKEGCDLSIVCLQYDHPFYNESNAIKLEKRNIS